MIGTERSTNMLIMRVVFVFWTRMIFVFLDVGLGLFCVGFPLDVCSKGSTHI